MYVGTLHDGLRLGKIAIYCEAVSVASLSYNTDVIQFVIKPLLLHLILRKAIYITIAIIIT